MKAPAAEQTQVDPFPTAPDDAPPSPISILPLDVLSAIVEAVAEDEPPRSPTSQGERSNVAEEAHLHTIWDFTSLVQGGTLGWIRLTHVCRIWRYHIFESMPLLWARYIGVFREHDALEAMIRRAGDSIPLSVQSGPTGVMTRAECSLWSVVQCPSSRWSEADCMVFRSRMRSIGIVDLRKFPIDVHRDPLPSIVKDLSELQTLEVHYLNLDENSFYDEEMYTRPGVPILQAPNLRKVRFTNYFIPWMAAPMITHFSLALGHSSGLPGSTLFDTLNKIAPTVEILELDFCLTYSVDTATTISFPELQRLYLRDQDTCVHEFLQSIEVTSLTELDLTVCPSDRNWRSSVGPDIERALRFLWMDNSFDTMTARAVSSAYDTFGSPREHIRLEFSRARSDVSFTLALAIENVQHICEDQLSCLVAIQHALTITRPTIWDKISFVDLKLPLWKYGDAFRVLLHRLPNVPELRILNPRTRIKSSPTRLWSTPNQSVLKTHIKRVKRLHILQDVEWEPKVAEAWCLSVADELKGAISLAEDHSETCEQSLIELLRLDLVQKPGPVRGMDEEGLVAMFAGIAERVELRFL